MIITSVSKKVSIGRLSDGSDRQEITVYDVTVVDGTKTYFKSNCLEIPTEANIDLSTFEDITPQPTLEDKVNYLYYKSIGVI